MEGLCICRLSIRGQSTYGKLIGSSWCACLITCLELVCSRSVVLAGAAYIYTLQFLERGDLTVGLSRVVSSPDPTPPLQGKRVW